MDAITIILNSISRGYAEQLGVDLHFLFIVKVVTIWTNLAKNQETLIYMVKTFVQIVMSSTISQDQTYSG